MAYGHLKVTAPNGKTVNLDTDTLRGGTRIVRPANACGTDGFYPAAWTVAVIQKHETPRRAFLRVNRGWT